MLTEVDLLEDEDPDVEVCLARCGRRVRDQASRVESRQWNVLTKSRTSISCTVAYPPSRL